MAMRTTAPSEMIVDIAADQTLVGRPSLARREKILPELGFKILGVPSRNEQAKGIGVRITAENSLFPRRASEASPASWTLTRWTRTSRRSSPSGRMQNSSVQ
ncbi:unnamed protein product [Prorocentrum cordatum]|uniref:Uncharacterized protein n=1 Tax=Prorocentrum cordatum TaxID=2364126 RepID=A0ABN9R7C5_9DINO|nr:unnamed protein product [Polarella glacialis]